MDDERSKIQVARMTCISQEDAAKVVGCTPVTMSRKERNPGEFSLKEFFKLYGALGDDGRSIMWSYLEDRRNFFSRK